MPGNQSYCTKYSVYSIVLLYFFWPLISAIPEQVVYFNLREAAAKFCRWSTSERLPPENFFKDPKTFEASSDSIQAATVVELYPWLSSS